MNSSWRRPDGKKTGSTRYWRKVREAIVREHGLICHLCHQGISLSYRSPHGQSLEVHHLLGSQAGRYDRRFLRPVHRQCNLAVGAPIRILPSGRPYDPPGRITSNPW